MSNPVSESIISWQPDAISADSNAPTANDNAGVGQSQDLSGNLRLLKSEMRSESILKSWERWKGVKNLAATGNIAFTYVSATQFSVNDDFTNASRNVAVVGRRVKAIGGSTIYGTIVAASYAASATTVTVLLDSGSLDGTLTEVQFGPNLNSLLHIKPTLLTNRTGALLAVGDPAVFDSANDSSVIQIGVQGSQRQHVVSLAPIPDGVIGPFVFAGLVETLRVNGAVTRSHFLRKSTSGHAEDMGIAEGDAVSVPVGAFALAASSFAGPGLGTVSALLFGMTQTEPSDVDAIGFLKNNSLISIQPNLNLIEGSGISLTLADNGPDSRADLTIALAALQVGTGQLKTATGSASGTVGSNLVMNDFSFFPSLTSTNNAWTIYTHFNTGDPGEETGRIQIFGGTGTWTARWRYITASDDPIIWVAYEPATGAVLAVWASDDPTPSNVPGLVIPGATIVALKAEDLRHLNFSSEELAQADAFIEAKNLRSEHRLYRALQAKDSNPSHWILNNSNFGKDGLRMGKVVGVGRPAQTQRATDLAIFKNRTAQLMADKNVPQALRDAFGQLAKLID